MYHWHFAKDFYFFFKLILLSLYFVVFLISVGFSKVFISAVHAGLSKQNLGFLYISGGNIKCYIIDTIV